MRSSDGIHVPDLSGLRLRFAKHADARLTLSMVGGLVVKKGELVIISDENFWMYMTEDTALFQWDPPTPLDIDKADVLLDIQASERRGEVEICAIPASGIPDLDVGWSLKVYHTPLNPRGCSPLTPPDDRSFLDGGQVSKAVVVDRGECTFLHKAEMAKKAGYDMIIVVDPGLTAGQRFIPSLLTEKGSLAPSEDIVPLVLVTGKRDANLIQRAEKVRIAGTRARERRMVVRGGNSQDLRGILIVEYVSNVLVKP